MNEDYTFYYQILILLMLVFLIGTSLIERKEISTRLDFIAGECAASFTIDFSDMEVQDLEPEGKDAP